MSPEQAALRRPEKKPVEELRAEIDALLDMMRVDEIEVGSDEPVPHQATLPLGVLALGEEAEWMADAACLNYDQELFHPSADLTTKERNILERQAKAICKTKCPVREDCLDYAMDNQETSGVWGGLSSTEIRKLVSRTKP